MSVLDDPQLIADTDPAGFLALVEEYPQQVEDGWLLGKQVTDLPSARDIDGIVVLGMGGSGISGNVLKAALGVGFSLPVRVSKGYGIPGWVGPNTLVFAVSYSGETEETLEAYEKARVAGARVVTVSSGGTLTRLGSEHGCAAVNLKTGLQPRAALGYLSMPLLAVCQGLGIGDYEADLTETLGLLRRRAAQWSRTVPAEANPAKQLAESLKGTVPVVYGAEGLGAVAAYRWKCQLNECSKVHAFENSFSEMNHNEVMGWTPGNGGRFSVVTLRHPGEHPRIKDRFRVTLPILQERAAYCGEVRTEASSSLARLLDLIYMGDFVATYLAIASGVDPSSIELIDRVKAALKLKTSG
ncbi:MAG TPA: bifunctional phosphoglucose/phosphomannose isomerase [Actinomycetota bacterium]|nr:bifunctional phosphoglucose/phosphomannose isomerase [Actinomycetota bacterium]